MHNSQLITIFNIPNSDVNISATAKLKFNNNPAYETQTQIQKNLAYEDTTLAIYKCEESQAITNPAEPAYEIIPLIPIQAASATTQNPSSGEEDGYNKLNRDIVKQK